MVPEVGLEPTRLSTTDFESVASTNLATRAVVPLAGLEPATSALSRQSSNRV